MKILFITNKFPPLVDGVGDYTYNLAHEFAKHRHEVTVVCKDHDGIHTIYDDIKVLPIVKAWNKQALQPVINVIKERQIEVVSLQYVPHGFHPKGLPFALIGLVRAIRKQGVPLFTFCHEVCTFYGKGVKQDIISYMMRYITKKILINSNIIATSIKYYCEIIKVLVPDYPSRIEQIPIVSNIPEKINSREEILSLRNKVAAKDEIIISFFGQRNTKVSLEVIERLKRSGHKVKVLFIGKIDDTCTDLSDIVYKTGVLSIDEINPYFLISDILILPEDNYYGCSFKSGSLAAALKNGLTVVTAKGILTDGSMKDNENIIFVDFLNPLQLEESLVRLIRFPHIRERIGNAARILVENYNWETTYISYLDLVNQLS